MEVFNRPQTSVVRVLEVNVYLEQTTITLNISQPCCDHDHYERCRDVTRTSTLVSSQYQNSDSGSGFSVIL